MVTTSDLIEEFKNASNVLSEAKFIKLLHAIVKWSTEGILLQENISFFSFCKLNDVTILWCILHVNSLLTVVKWNSDNFKHSVRYFQSLRYYVPQDVSPLQVCSHFVAWLIYSPLDILYFRKWFSSSCICIAFSIPKHFKHYWILTVIRNRLVKFLAMESANNFLPNN